jgi:Flp pilus assembly protein TadB
MFSFNLFTIGLISIVCIIAIILTYRILKEEEKKLEDLKESGDTVQDEIKRSHEYEEKSWGTGIPLISWIYVIATVGAIILFVVYIA